MALQTLLVTTSGLQLIGSNGTLSTIALPAGILPVSGQPASIAALNGNVIVAGPFSQALWVRPDLSLSILSLPKPGAPPVLSSGGAGVYAGTRQARVQFLIKSGAQIQGYGPLSDVSTAFTYASQKQTISSIPVSTHPSVNARRIYFTVTNGANFFFAFDINDNSTTSQTVDIADAALSLVAVDPTQYVTAPNDLSLVAVWKDRVWGKSGIDTLVGTASGRVEQWNLAFPIHPKGVDTLGITGFLPTRDELAICRRNLIWKMTGSDETNFTLVKLVEGKGCIAPASCLVIRNTGYFLSDDGVYSWSPGGVSSTGMWSPGGVQSLTDDLVRPWFTTDTYFNRAGFANAFAGYDPVRHQYVLFLPVAGGSTTVMNRWITLDLNTGKWFGPHQTAAGVTFAGAAVAPDTNNVLRLVLGGSDDYLYAFTPGTFTDGASSAIAFDVKSKPHWGDSPDLTHLWQQPTILTKKDVGGFLTVTPSLGDIGASAGTAQSHDLTKERERLSRLGVGRLATLEFTQNTNAQGVELYGYEVPYVTLGRR